MISIIFPRNSAHRIRKDELEIDFETLDQNVFRKVKKYIEDGQENIPRVISNVLTICSHDSRLDR